MKSLSQQITTDLVENQEIDLPRAENFKDDFEALLTFLYDNQPWLTHSENLRNTAAYIDVVSSLERAISDAQNRVFQEPIIPWLAVLTFIWRANSSTVITFNYDDIVESAARELLRDQSGSFMADLHSVPLTLDNVRGSTGGMWGTRRHVPFHLLKLHGSVSWYYSGPDAPLGDTVFKRSDFATWRKRYSRTEHDEISGSLVDKEPLIVPPTAVKTGFYGNKILTAQWNRARKALNSAEELHILGYSAPESDLMVRSLIGTEFHGRKLVFVNPDNSAANRVCEFMDPGSLPEIVPFNGIDEYVNSLAQPRFYCEQHADDNELEPFGCEYNDLARKPVTQDHCPLCPQTPLQEAHGNDAISFTCACCQSAWHTATLTRWKMGAHVKESGGTPAH